MQLRFGDSVSSPAIRRIQKEENKEDLDDALPDTSGDELGASVHIPRGVLSKFLRK